MEFRKALESDFSQIIALQNKNLSWVLTEEEKQNGFLSTVYSQEDFKQMNEDICVSVCEKEGKIIGYLGAGTVEFYKKFLFPAAVIERCRNLSYKGMAISKYKFFFANPICIEKEYRGGSGYENIFNNLCFKLLELLPKKYNLAVTFIAQQNQPSLSASKRMGMEIIDKFNLSGQSFLILVREINGEV